MSQTTPILVPVLFFVSRGYEKQQVYLKYTFGAGNEREFPFWKRYAWRLSRL